MKNALGHEDITLKVKQDIVKLLGDGNTLKLQKCGFKNETKYWQDKNNEMGSRMLQKDLGKNNIFFSTMFTEYKVQQLL